MTSSLFLTEKEIEAQYPWTTFKLLFDKKTLCPLPYRYIHIQATREMAICNFVVEFGFSPKLFYRISRHKTLDEASAYERKCIFSPDHSTYENESLPRSVVRTCICFRLQCRCDEAHDAFISFQPLEEYVKRNDILIMCNYE